MVLAGALAFNAPAAGGELGLVLDSEALRLPPGQPNVDKTVGFVM
jgi:hypothetical protein